MADVRLTATNPEDSSVVPVACNEKGELKLEEPIAPPEFDGNLDGDLHVSGETRLRGRNYFDGVIEFGLNGNESFLAAGRHADLWDGGSQDAYGTVFGTKPGFTSQVTRNISFVVGGGPYGAAKIRAVITEQGGAIFSSDVEVGSRGERWRLAESGGLCHMVKVSKTNILDKKKPVDPPLRNIPAELTMVERTLAEVMKKLKMTPPAGWEAWDGSSGNS